MTKITKIATSTVASALLLGGSAFAGTISYNLDGMTGKQVVVADELFVPTADIKLIGDSSADDVPSYRYDRPFMTYSAELDGSGTVSDATVNLKFSNGTVSVPDGYKVVIVDKTDNNKIISVQNDGVDTDKIVLDSDDSYMYRDGHDYNVFVLEEGNANLGDEGIVQSDDDAYITINGTKTDIASESITLELWSTSGTEEIRDTATITPFTTTPQYKVACETKLNNLINVENAATAFVATKHGALNTSDGTEGDVMDVLSDVMRFTVEKYTVDVGLDGNTSRVLVTANQDLSTFVTVSHNFESADMSGVGTWINANEVAIDSGADESTPAYYGLDASTHTYTAKFTVDGNTSIPETKFTANFYINQDTEGTTYTPADSYTPNSAIGEWVNFAYIAQVAGAETGGNQDMKTKFYITNRSCKTVTPVFTVVMNGQEYTNVTVGEVAVNEEKIFFMKDIIAAAGIATVPETSTKASVEITIPGNAEDFYVYAQGKNGELGQFKDLPVYNTSTRTY